MVCKRIKYTFFVAISISFVALSSYAQGIYNDKDTVKTIKPNEYNKFFYPNGIISSEGMMKEGKPDGLWKNYYDNGRIRSEGVMIAGKNDGTWKFFYQSGYVSAELLYTKGGKTGQHKSYYDTSKIKSIENYIENLKQGLSIYYCDNGSLLKEVPFKDNFEEGIVKEYDCNGELTNLIYYKTGFITREQRINRTDRRGLKQGPWKKFYDLSQILKWEGVYKDGKKNGLFIDYDSTGKIIKKQNYIDDVPAELVKKNAKTGKVVKYEVKKSYYPNAQEKEIGTYKDGVPDGVFRQYDEYGNIIGSKNFRDGYIESIGILDEMGLQQGFWTYFYRNSKVKSSGFYKDGKRISTWKSYYDNGQLTQEGAYIEDKATGVWTWYYPSGRLMRTEIYVDNLLQGQVTEYKDDSTKTVIAQGNYLNGKKDGTWNYDVGDIHVSGNYQDDKEEGVWKEVYSGGGLCFEGPYSGGVENGTHKYYYDNGKLKEDRLYKLGSREGNWKVYDRNGSRIVTITYKNDKELKINGKSIDLKKVERGRKPLKK